MLDESEIVRRAREEARIIKNDARVEANELRIKANKGVLIGTGGYSRNWDMLKNWLTVPTMFSMETPACTGEGIKMGQALGANVKMTAYIWGEACLQDVPDDECTDEYISENGPNTVRFKIYGYNSQPSAIFVNQRGERFCAESVDYDSLYYGFLGQNTTGDMEQWNWPTSSAIRRRATSWGTRSSA